MGMPLQPESSLIEVMDFSPAYGALVTRAVYFGRFLGTLVVLVSGLFFLGAEYQRMEIYLGVAFLLAISLAAAVPVDITEIDSPGLFSLGIGAGFAWSGIIAVGTNMEALGLGTSTDKQCHRNHQKA